MNHGYRNRENTPGNLPVRELKRIRDYVLIIVFACFLIVIGQLFNLQIVQGEKYRSLSKENYLRITPIPAPRGEILDRDGELLVTSRPAFTVFYWYLDEKEAATTLPHLADILGMEPAEVEEKVRKYEGRYFEPVPIARDITPEIYTKIVEDAPNLPGVFIDPQPIRYYPQDDLLSTTLGYVGEITQSQLDDPQWKDYKMGSIVGQQGLELYYESILRGINGGYQVEVDYRGRPTGNVGPGIDPEPGKSIQLEIDLDLQMAVEEALKSALEQNPEAKGASAVVLDVKTGGVLSIASVPGFDPNILISGISYKDLNQKITSGEWRFANLAATGLYPPGSAFKIVTAVAALAEGKTDRTEEFFDPGYHPSAPTLICHKWGGHGYVNIEEALEVSCNTYFYEMGRRLGVDTLAEYCRALGLGMKTGIDLGGENYGTVPSTEWKAKAYGEGRVAQPEFLFSEHMMVAMGQAFHLYTPIQMASVTQAVANQGVRMRPRLVSKILDSEGNVVEEFLPEVSGELVVDPGIFDIVKAGMLRVTNEPGGTAYWIFHDCPVKVCGKTGTAQNPLGDDHSWFVGFGPYEDPEIALAVVVDQGGSGSAVAAPVARQIFDAFLAITQPQEAEQVIAD
ncbi:MAG: penicillin-binding protein 2 [Bacillota bacterium]|jgi:penicillin-binding protein 2|nr:penicillin-binding protein 2 [Candidatus Fermentithermobacillaceae bacterium]